MKKVSVAKKENLDITIIIEKVKSQVARRQKEKVYYSNVERKARI